MDTTQCPMKAQNGLQQLPLQYFSPHLWDTPSYEMFCKFDNLSQLYCYFEGEYNLVNDFRMFTLFVNFGM